jgi:hypothetical protein
MNTVAYARNEATLVKGKENAKRNAKQAKEPDRCE